MAIPVLATANTPAQRRLGKYWKSIQRVTYALWALTVIHLLLLDGFKPFGAATGDGDPVSISASTKPSRYASRSSS